MAEKQDNTGKLEIAVRILGNELVALKKVGLQRLLDQNYSKW